MKTPTRSQLIAELVRQARDEAGLNNSSLAREAGLPRRTIVRITGGTAKGSPEIETLERIAAATKKPLSYFQIEPKGASDRVRAAAEDLVSALVEELHEKLARATEGAKL